MKEKDMIDILAEDGAFVNWVKTSSDKDVSKRLAFGDNSSQVSYKDVAKRIMNNSLKMEELEKLEEEWNNKYNSK